MVQQNWPRPAKWQIDLDALAQLQGLITPETGLILAALAAKVPADTAILEVGSFRGKSTCYLAAGARMGLDAHVWAVDPWDKQRTAGKHNFNDRQVFLDFNAQVASVGLSDQVTPIRDFSQEAVKRWSSPIGLLYIDGSHTYEDVKADFDAWSKFCVPDATVAFDDYGTKPNPGVTRFVDELGERCRLEFCLPLAIAVLP